MTSFFDHAGCWFLRSGIQSPPGAEMNGGVARFHLADSHQNAPVSSEITGYAASAFAYLYSLTGNRGYLDACARAAGFLRDRAWDSATGTFPFEPGSPYTYFFDTGIIARGLMAAARATGDESFAARAHDAARSLACDFRPGANVHPAGAYAPIIELPHKQPLDYDPRWSRSPGCYQLKSALAWLDVDDPQLRACFGSALDFALATHDSFPTAAPDREKQMDRLHAYCYFLEALLFAGDRHAARRALADGIDRTAALLREISSAFERSDVCAQLLRIRLIAHHLDFVPLDEPAAREEAARAAKYQALDDSSEQLRGGFWFGSKRGAVLPFMNPVSTAFSMQALALWDEHRENRWRFELPQLI